jgi:hypothetical protein
VKGSWTHFGNINVAVDEETVFDINGDLYEGTAGLEMLYDLPENTVVIVEGQLSFQPKKFLAKNVTAGTSVPGATSDIVTGHVVGRSGDTLKINGTVLSAGEGRLGFKKSVSVTIGDESIVRKLNSEELLSKFDVSPGQKVSVSGVFTDNDDELVIDAGAGTIVLLPTTLKGVVAENDDTLPMAINIAAIDNKNPAVFDFQGTGLDAENDADPDFYEIYTGLLDISGFSLDDPVKIIGYVSPFGTAPDDFSAMTLVNLKDVRAFIKVQWKRATSELLMGGSQARLQLNLNETHRFHHIGRGGVIEDLNDFDESPVIETASESSVSGTFILKMKKGISVYDTIEGFQLAVELSLSKGFKFKNMFASGGYNAELNILNADYICISED